MIIEEIPTSNEKTSPLSHIKQKYYVYITVKNFLKHEICFDIFNHMQI